MIFKCWSTHLISPLLFKILKGIKNTKNSAELLFALLKDFKKITPHSSLHASTLCVLRSGVATKALSPLHSFKACIESR